MSLNSLIMAALPAIAIVESGGRPESVGDGGAAIGAYQIHAEVIDDVNRVDGTHFVWPDDCVDPEKARDICARYLRIWGSRLSNPTIESLARIWNGGPNGWRKKQTVAYGERVLRIMNQFAEVRRNGGEA